jgi:hypothetical protein
MLFRKQVIHRCKLAQLAFRCSKSSNGFYEQLKATLSAPPLQVLKKIVWYLCLAAHDPMQRSLMQATHDDKKLLELPKFK